MIALDTNILIYAEQSEDDQGRHKRALSLVEKLATGEHCVPLQVLGEFANVCLRQRLLNTHEAQSKLGLYAEIFQAPTTSQLDLIAAAALKTRFNFQYFDAVILTVAMRAGATILLSEDMQDGLELDGLRIVNPFAAENEALLADYFGSAL